MKYVFVLVFILVYFLTNGEGGFTTTSLMYTRFAYMFQHAGVVHLVVNSVAFIGMFATLEQWMNKWRISAIAVICAFFATFFSANDVPTVGASSMVYMMVGIYIGFTLFNPEIKITDIRKYLLFVVAIGVSLLASFFKEGSNFLLHVVSLLMGVCVESVFRVSKKW